MSENDVTRVLIALADLKTELIERITRVETQVSERTVPGKMHVAGLGAGGGISGAILVEAAVRALNLG